MELFRVRFFFFELFILKKTISAFWQIGPVISGNFLNYPFFGPEQSHLQFCGAIETVSFESWALELG